MGKRIATLGLAGILGLGGCAEMGMEINKALHPQAYNEDGSPKKGYYGYRPAEDPMFRLLPWVLDTNARINTRWPFRRFINSMYKSCDCR